MMRPLHAVGTVLLLACLVLTASADEPADPSTRQIAEQLRELDSRVIVLGTVRQPPLAGMLARDAEARLREANRADRKAWSELKSKADWERFRERRLAALCASLGEFPPVPKDLQVSTTGTAAGDGYRVDNVTYVTRPGNLVTANLYRPARPAAAALPAILICHSHQSAKHNGWRQDMAMTWARAGCLVLVPDHLGHGERRQHPFTDDARHDYHLRYDLGMQLQLASESLMGRLTWDLMRGVDLLLAQPGVDPRRILLISEPAGGGDVAAVTAALDNRITGVMVQNFGGPEPENAYPLARDADESFDYTGGGSWESTRNLRLSARDGFLPWLIVAATAPRRLIYFHEFYWDREQDPVWKRLQQVYRFYGADGALEGLAGRGFVVGSAPENTHWLPENRALLYPLLERWFAIPNPRQEYGQRRPESELLCLSPTAVKQFAERPLHVELLKAAQKRLATMRATRASLSLDERREQLRRDWARLLGDIAPDAEVFVQGLPWLRQELPQFAIERLHLRTEPGIVVPAILLLPRSTTGQHCPVVFGVAQHGKQEFLRQRSEDIARLLAGGIAVCLPDLRGTGETSPGDERSRASAATAISASQWMVGQSLLGGRLRDLRALVKHLQSHPALDPRRIAVWGESFAGVNAPDVELVVPHTAANRPAQSEPLGGLVALLAALYEDDVRAVYVRGGLGDFASVLAAPYCYVPHDAIVPGLLAVGDLSDLAAAVSPRPLWLNELVDGQNRALAAEDAERLFQATRVAYDAAGARPQLVVGRTKAATASAADWLQRQLGTVEAPIPGIGPTGAIVRVQTGFKFTEGPAADSQGNLFFTDIPNNRIHRLDVAGQLTTFLDDSQACNGLMFEGGGRLLACQGKTHRVIAFDTQTKRVTVVADQLDGQPLAAVPNDLVIDRSGGVYFTDPDVRSVFYTTGDGAARRLLDGLPRPNGVLLSPDETTLYVLPSGSADVMAYPVQAAGRIGEGRVLCRLPANPQQPGRPGGDGLAIDTQGNLYLTRPSLQQILVFDSQGKQLGAIRVPEEPANCAFGGRDRKTLFVTARTSVYAIPMEATGHVFPGRLKVPVAPGKP